MTEHQQAKWDGFKEFFDEFTSNFKDFTFHSAGGLFVAGALVLAGGFVATIVSENHQAEREAETVKQYTPLVTADPRNVRLQNVLRYAGSDTLKSLSEEHYRVALVKLSNGAMAEIDHDEISIESALAADTQADTLRLATNYIEGQKRDRQPFGYGELFRIGAGEVVSCGKNCQEHKEILQPVAAVTTPKGPG